ncbi:RE1-silencing transcription factor [Armadillidium vulgare]|nr:RE1-silencing transcription factor [Armadillidium vulgare]
MFTLTQYLCSHYPRMCDCKKCCFKAEDCCDLKCPKKCPKRCPKIKCRECAYQCYTKTALKNHCQKRVEPKWFCCPRCSYRSKCRDDIKIHFLNCHWQKILYKCPKCDYTTDKKHCLDKHCLTHEEKKCLKCPKCCYETNYPSCLKIHILNHENEKLFKCNVSGMLYLWYK